MRIPPSSLPAASAAQPEARRGAEMLLDELVFRRMRVSTREVVFVKGVIEASEGLAAVFAEHGG
ncbi:MAG TPA: hypothetical protein VJT73_05025, partial [Polyangiaceae bacterium]|nr:hypothetical protein [Polyangiaceae bacterium]